MNPRASIARHYSLSGPQSLRTLSPNGGLKGQHSSFIQALDLHSAPELDISSALASLRVHVLTYLGDLETRLALLDFKFQSTSRAERETSSFSKGSQSSSSSISDDEEGVESEVEEVPLEGFNLTLNTDDVAQFINNGLELLQNIRADVTSYLPDVELATLPSAAAGLATSRENLRRRLNELGIHPLKLNLEEITNKLSEFEIPNMPAMPVMPSMPTMDSLRTKLSELDLDPRDHLPLVPLSYVPRLKEHLGHLQEHMQELHSCFSSSPLSETPFPFQIGLSPPKAVTDLLTDLLEEDTEEAIEADIKKAEEEAVSSNKLLVEALKKSHYGRVLLKFEDLPPKWHNNEYVHTGYRYVAIHKLRMLNTARLMSYS